MNLSEIAEKIREGFGLVGYVESIYDGDAYDTWNNKEVRYLSACFELESIETAISQDKQTISDLQAQVQTLTSEKQQLTTEKQQLVTEKQTLSDANTQLQNEVNTLKQKPAESTAHVVNDKHDQQVEKTDAELYLESCANAQSLFNELP